MRLKYLISIGHSAYNGVNAWMQFRTPAGCIKELINRGVKPHEARAVVEQVLADPHGYGLVNGHFGGVVEVRNDMLRATVQQWPLLSYDLDHWKKAKEYALSRRGPMPPNPHLTRSSQGA